MASLVVRTPCSFAVIGCFRHHPEDRHWFRTLAAPPLGGVGTIAVVGLLEDAAERADDDEVADTSTRV
ncbi:hypothetical protein GCM10010254_43930 [Streptomyces chromofuscus]|nr:hypothetical protein GCM10010254_43930 [Streptomyces chromofuscus]